MKRCRRGEEDENDTKKRSKFIEKCLTKFNRSWSDLHLDLLGEIKKKLYGADHIRFNSVCKSWRAAQHGTRPADVLPWLMVIDREDVSKINYYLFEPSTPHLKPAISDTIYLDRFFDISRMDISFSIIYRDGCLFISLSNIEGTYSYFLLLTLRTKKVVTIPPLRHPLLCGASNCKMFTAVSSNPTSPDCIFLVLHYTNDYMREVSTFRRGDADWKTTDHFGSRFGFPCTEDVVFLHGNFFFLFSCGRIGCYNTCYGILNCLDLQSAIHLRHFRKFFGLDGELMVECYDAEARKVCIRRFDWSQNVWVPLQSLGNRSLFLSSRSVYVDATNYYGVSANKIYVRRDRICYVYSLKNGRMLKCTLSGLRNWDGLDYDMEYSVWVEPHVFLP